MSVFHRSTSLMSGVSPSCRQTSEHPKVCLSPALSLSSPVIRKKTIQIPSFDEKGLIFEKRCAESPAADRPLDLISSKASGHLFCSKTRQRNHKEKASTLPKTKPNVHSAQLVSAKPHICISAASQPSTPSTRFTVKPEPSLLVPSSQRSGSDSVQQRLCPPLTVPAPRLSSSPTHQETGPSSQQDQSSSVPKERRARWSPIPNSRVSAPNKVKHEILDQRTLCDFTRPRRESRPQTEPYNLPGTSQSFNFLHNKVGTKLNENVEKDQPRCLNRNLNVDSASKPKANISQQQERQVKDVTEVAHVVHRQAQTEPDVLLNQSVNFTLMRSNNSSDVASTPRSSEQIYSVKRATLPMMPKPSSSTEPRVSPASAPSGTGPQPDSDHATRADTSPLSGSSQKKPREKTSSHRGLRNSSQFFPQASQHIRSSQEPPQTTQMDSKSSVSLFDLVSEDHSWRSADASHGLNQVKKSLLAAQTLEAPRPDHCTFSQANSNVESRLNQERSLWPKKSHRESKVSDMKQRRILEAPAPNQVPTEAPAYLQAPAVAPGRPSRSVESVHLPQTSGEATRHQTHGLKSSVTLKVFITDDLEEPYVTMHRPESVYVDMSDVVPPEVRPKPAVPAKPPNVGAPSPSSPFPPQGLGIGGGGISAPPPSAIPVLVGGHGPSHGSGHVGGHAAAHGVGHSHGGSHSSSGGSTLLGYIGIDTIIEQMRRKTMKTGFDFNIMVVGHSGLGKSTLVNTLFKSQVSRKNAGWARDEKIPKTVEIKTVSHVIEEGGVKMKLTIVDTPGFGDQINNESCWEPISKYINEQFEKFLKEEVNITRKKRIPDTRVHCCLYFIPPTGHCLRQLDTEFMRRLSHSVNIIPVIAKSDTMTMEERQEFKQRVKKELETNGIEFYPQKEFDDDMEDKSDNDKIREAMPFAVVGSDKEHQVNGKRVLGRKTPWGVIEVENPNHCEFAQLRDFLIRSHLQDLKEVTHNIHYETYRAKRLNENGGLHPISSDTQESNL